MVYHPQDEYNFRDDFCLPCLFVGCLVAVILGLRWLFGVGVVEPERIVSTQPFGEAVSTDYSIGILSDFTIITTDVGTVPIRGRVSIPSGAVVEKWTTSRGIRWVGVYHRGDVIHQGPVY